VGAVSRIAICVARSVHSFEISLLINGLREGRQICWVIATAGVKNFDSEARLLGNYYDCFQQVSNDNGSARPL
jgi:hypothetical protein